MQSNEQVEVPWLCAYVAPGSHDKIIKRCIHSHEFHHLQIIILRYYDQELTSHGVVLHEHRLPYLLVHMNDQEIRAFCDYNREVIKFLRAGGKVYHLKPGELSMVLSWCGGDEHHKYSAISEMYDVGRSVVCLRGVFKGMRGVVNHVATAHSCKVSFQIRDSEIPVELPFSYLAGLEEDEE